MAAMSEREVTDHPEDAPESAESGAANAADEDEIEKSILAGLWRPVLVIAMITIVVYLTNPSAWIDDVPAMRMWLREKGAWGFLLFLAVYIFAAVALIPQAVLKVAAGGLFGGVVGMVVASVGSTLGAAACFLIARYIAGGSLAKRIRQRERVQKLDDLTRKHGAAIVALSRLVPVLPGNLVNYAWGLTKVRFVTFVFWSWLCMLPGTVVLVVGTDALLRGLEEGRVPWGMLVVIAVALALLFIALVYARRQIRRA
jgi:uncharacterized membrane protein YdjX (TVP38/TMEM64 family)